MDQSSSTNNQQLEKHVTLNQEHSPVSQTQPDQDQTTPTFLNKPTCLTRKPKSIRVNKHKTRCKRTFSSLKRYIRYEKLGEGTFGVVFKARPRNRPDQIVAVKKIIERKVDQTFPLTAFREMEAVKSLHHPNIIDYVDFIMDNDEGERRNINIPGLKTPRDVKEGDHYYMVFPYMHSDLAGILMNPLIDLDLPNIKSIMKQLFTGLDYLHTMNYIHRDIKTANILLDSYGVVKIADLGLIRSIKDRPVTLTHQGGGVHRLTPVVMTRWYRAPECVFQEPKYGTAVDMWSSGCVFGEMFDKRPIMKGNTDIDQGLKIFEMVGWPTEETMPGWTHFPLANSYIKPVPGGPLLKTKYSKILDAEGVDLMEKLLTLDPEKRITAGAALIHPYFSTEPLPLLHVECNFEESHEGDKERFKIMRAKIEAGELIPRPVRIKQEFPSQQHRQQSPYKPTAGHHRPADPKNSYFKAEEHSPQVPSHPQYQHQHQYNKDRQTKQLPNGPSVTNYPQQYNNQQKSLGSKFGSNAEQETLTSQRLPVQPSSMVQSSHKDNSESLQRGGQTGGGKSNNLAAYTTNTNREVPNTTIYSVWGQPGNEYSGSRVQSQYEYQSSQQETNRTGSSSRHADLNGEQGEYTVNNATAAIPLGINSIPTGKPTIDEANQKFNDNHPKKKFEHGVQRPNNQFHDNARDTYNGNNRGHNNYHNNNKNREYSDQYGRGNYGESGNQNRNVNGFSDSNQYRHKNIKGYKPQSRKY